MGNWLTFAVLLIALMASVFFLEWDRKTRLFGVLLTAGTAAALVVLPVSTGEVGPSIAAVGSASFWLGLVRFGPDRQARISKLLIVIGLPVAIVGVAVMEV